MKRFLPRTLFGRSLLIIVTPLILFQIVATYVFYDRHWDTVSRRLASNLAGDVAAVIQSIGQFPGSENRARVFATARTHMDLSLRLEAGAILPNQAPKITGSILDRMLVKALEERVRRPFHIHTENFKHQVGIDVQLPEGVLHIVAPGKRVFSSSTYIFVMWMVGTSLVLFAVAIIFMRNQIRPIRRLTAAADSFGKGQDMVSFRPAGASEVRRAATAFNMMRDRIRRQISQRTELLAGVSHDLRTPLTRMKLQLAMLGDGAEIDELKSDVTEMERMVEGYLEFVRGDSSESPVELDLSVLLGEIVDDARREGNEIKLDAESDLTAMLRPSAFKRCVSNLVANAARHGEHVAIHAARRNGVVEIAIEDDGPGIPKDERENVFKPFYRLDGSRNPNTGGVGLGLTLARDIIRSHGGDIALGDSADGGLRVRLRLPA